MLGFLTAPHPTRDPAQSLNCFPASGAERRAGSWARCPLPSERSLPRLRQHDLQLDGSSGCSSMLLPPWHSLTLQLIGDTREAEQALCQGGHGWGLSQAVWGLGQPSWDGSPTMGWRGAGGPPWLAAPLPITLSCSLFAAQRHSSHLLSCLVGAVLASRQGDRRCQEPLPRP